MSQPYTVPRAFDGMTLDEFLAVPQEKPYQEFIDGRVSEKPGFTALQGEVVARLCMLLDEYVRAHAPQLVTLLMLDHIHRSPGAERFFIPDVCLRDRDEMRAQRGGGIVSTPPPFVAEIILPEHSARFVGDRMAFYMSTGTQVAWFIDAEASEVDVLRAETAPQRCSASSILRIPGEVPGFELPLDKLLHFDD